MSKPPLEHEDQKSIPRTVVDSMGPHTELGDLFEEETIQELRMVKNIWHLENLLWRPWLKDIYMLTLLPE